MRHETPSDVAVVLARHAPTKAERILDPAVGNGALLLPLIERCRRTLSRVVCVDSDKSVLPTVKKSLSFLSPRTINCIHDDFLSWSSRFHERFDCIVMNPPFAARRKEWVRVDLASEFETDNFSHCFAPIEIAFFCRTIRLLKAGGRLLAIVPSSVVAGEMSRGFREAMLSAGSVKYVHELPHFSFDGVESRMYLLVFDKGKKHCTTTLCNHDLRKPEVMTVVADSLASHVRFDFGFFKGQRKLKRLLNHDEYEWRPLSELITIHRGTRKSPLGPQTSVHTCDYRNGFWLSDKRHRIGRRGLEIRLKIGDILVKRVSRSPASSFGKSVGLRGMECSDCVLVLRPNANHLSTRILFALRCLVALPWIAPLLERGTGASYITEQSLNELRVPTSLHKCFPRSFKEYKAAIHSRAFSRMQLIESSVANQLCRKCTSGFHE